MLEINILKAKRLKVKVFISDIDIRRSLTIEITSNKQASKGIL